MLHSLQKIGEYIVQCLVLRTLKRAIIGTWMVFDDGVDSLVELLFGMFDTDIIKVQRVDGDRGVSLDYEVGVFRYEWFVRFLGPLW